MAGAAIGAGAGAAAIGAGAGAAIGAGWAGGAPTRAAEKGVGTLPATGGYEAGGWTWASGLTGSGAPNGFGVMLFWFTWGESEEVGTFFNYLIEL